MNELKTRALQAQVTCSGSEGALAKQRAKDRFEAFVSVWPGPGGYLSDRPLSLANGPVFETI